jgi:hypothetical protein
MKMKHRQRVMTHSSSWRECILLEESKLDEDTILEKLSKIHTNSIADASM